VPRLFTTRVFFCFLAALPGIAAMAAARDVTRNEAEVITYLFEDFEHYTPGLWRGRSEVQARCEAETRVVHGGGRAGALSWDFSKCPDASMSFANFVFHRRLVGRVQEVRVWVYADKTVRGTRLALWIADRSGEIFIRRATVDWTGWKQATFPLAGVGAGWRSGDGNGAQDPPLSLFGLAVDYGGPRTGRVVIDDISVVTMATPREALALTPDTNVPHNLFWTDAPVIELPVRNYARRAVPGVRCELRIEDLYSGRVADSATLDFGVVPGGKTVTRTQRLKVSFGVFRVHWRLADGQGELLEGTLDVSRMMPPCYRDAPEAVRRYDRHWSVIGGVFGTIDPDVAGDMGARWVRYEDTTWATYEKTPGVFDMTGLAKGLRRFRDVGIEAVILQTLYQRPEFQDPDQPAFARGYGTVMRHTAETARGLAHCFELGNEDNGPTKMLYSEIARHGAAGVRSAQPLALIANSGTAFIDLGWLKMQAARGVLDGLDALCTHPYTAGDSPEAWNTFGRLEQVNDLIDTLGGMKVQWSTEFGWPLSFPEKKRTEWIPRHFLIGAAAGLERHGLYTWQRDYGIFQGTALPPAASVHALAKMLEGHRFAGLLRHDDALWVCVWERAGAPLAIAWSPAGKASWSVRVDASGRAWDLFGNPLPVTPNDGVLQLKVGGGPVYVTGVAASVLEEAVRNRARRERARFARCVRRARLPENSPWARLAAAAHVRAVDLRRALSDWKSRGTPVGRGKQAVIAQALRWYSAVGRLPGAPAGTVPAEALRQRKHALENVLTAQVAADRDIPSLRYLLWRWERLADEEAVARTFGATGYAARVAAIEETTAALAERFAEHGKRRLFSIWPYLHATPPGGALRETLHFVPGETARVRLRVNSTSRRARRVTVSMRLPRGWRCDPSPVTLTVPPNAGREAELRIACPAATTVTKPVLVCELRTPDAGARTVTFDDVVIDPPVRVGLAPIPGLLPGTPVTLILENSGAKPVSGRVRLVRTDDARAVARVSFQHLKPGVPLRVSTRFRRFLPPLPFHEWPLTAEFVLGDGRRFERSVTADFACAVRAPKTPVVDGDLGDWRNAAPLHLDRPEYAKGSFGGKWTPEDLSAVTWVQWDDRFFYFAARVRDQTFNQTLSGRSQWMQDSIQIALARDVHSPRTEIGLALTPKGPEVVSYTGLSPRVPGSRLKVVLHEGGATYEAAIPWQDMPGLEKPVPGAVIRYAVLVNDDDAVTGRRFLERYGGIAHGKNIAEFGRLTLLSETGERGIAGDIQRNDVFIEDFEEYPVGRPPDAWKVVRHKPPYPSSTVVAGAGRHGSKGLVLRNSVGPRPYVYLHLVRPLRRVRPGERYELRCWMRGRGVSDANGIIGVCSDNWGNESFAYARAGKIGDAWQEVVFRFSGPSGGRLNIIIRNRTKTDELVIDDIRIRRLSP